MMNDEKITTQIVNEEKGLDGLMRLNIEHGENENKILYTVTRDRKKWRKTVLEAKVYNRLHVVHEKKKRKLHFVTQ